LAKILQFQHKTILNTNEIKRAYLQNLRIEKSSNSITTQQYYSQPKISNNTTNIENNITTQDPQTEQKIKNQNSQTPS
jgi:hypothetical protein